MRRLMTQREIDTDPARWHRLRARGITGSRIASIMGVDGAYGSPVSVYYAMTHGDKIPDVRRLRRGRHMEGFIADETGLERPGLTIVPAGLYCHSARPWHRATFDRFAVAAPSPGFTTPPWVSAQMRAGRVMPLQIKSVHSFRGYRSRDEPAEWGTPPDGDIPPAILAQCLWEIATGRFTAGLLAAYSHESDELRIYDIPRDGPAEHDISLMIKEAEGMLQRVARRDPPPADDRPATTAALKRVYAGGDPLASVVITDDALIAELRDVKEAGKALKTRAVLAENQLRALLGTALTATDPAGNVVVTRSQYHVTEKKPRSYDVDRITVRKGATA